MAIDEQKAVERVKRQQEYVTNFVKEKYDRISVTVPKGHKKLLKSYGIKSINGYINDLINADIEKRKRAASVARSAAVPEVEHVPAEEIP